MCRPILLLLPLWVMATSATHQIYPGTKTRPVLDDLEAAQYTKSKYLAGWNPEPIQHTRADYTVGSGHFGHIQEAINAAIKAGGTQRKYIHIEKGIYRQVIFIPKTTVPITIYGTPDAPAEVVITMTHSAITKGSQWATQVNPNGKVFKQGDPAWKLYSRCAERPTLGTYCSHVVWGQADNLEISSLTIINLSKEAQAVAAKFDGDKQIVSQVDLFGFQDTLYLNGKGKRIYLSRTTIKGDVDFIFGSSTAVLEGAHIVGRSDRPRTSGGVFAPNTDQSHKYGFLVINSSITAENGIKSQKGLSLGRAWHSKPTNNGQLVIRETVIDDAINVNAPYLAGTDGKPFSGNINKNRNLDDANFNRFWEYKNTGAGA